MQTRRVNTTRRARVQTLGDLDSARDVWIVLHGFGQLASDFLAPFAPIATDGRAIIAPEALNRFYREKAGETTHAARPVGATWMTREDREAEIADYVDYLDEVARQLAPGRSVTALGFSQGVATLMRWIAFGTTPVSRVIVWAGEIPKELDLLAQRARFPRQGLDLVIGSVDEYATWADVGDQRRRVEDAGLPSRLHIFDGGHRIDRGTLLALVSGQLPDDSI